jgi:hypothetical protein
MKKMHFLVAVLWLASCSEPPKPPKLHSKIVFEGMTLPGTYADAKSSGFTNCRIDYSNYECKLSDLKPISGIKPLSAMVHLDGHNNLAENYYLSNSPDIRTLSVEQLSYRSIHLLLPQDTFDDKCVNRKGTIGSEPPLECIKQKGIRFFISQLKVAGWVDSSRKAHTLLIHQGVPLEISIQPWKGEVTISPENIERINERINSIASAQASERNRQANANAVIEAMKPAK